MSEVNQGAPEVITKDDFLAFRDQVAQFAQAQARELQELKQRTAAAQPDPQQVAQANLPPDVDAKLREEIIGNPRRYTAEVVAIAKKQAKDEILQEVAAREAQRAQHEMASAFWGGFFQHNADLRAWEGEVSRYFAQTDPNADPSARANWAAEQVRAQLAEAAKAQRQAEERQKRGARQAAGAPGNMALPPMARDGALQTEPERLNAKEALAEFMADHDVKRAKTAWNNIDTPEYRANAQARAARVVLKRSA